MKTVFPVIAIAILSVLATTQALSCIRCSEARCTPIYKRNCKGGLTYGICGCCAVCAKLKGEKCGGIWNIHGKCDRGLTCDNERKGMRFRFFATGICVAKSKQFLV